MSLAQNKILLIGSKGFIGSRILARLNLTSFLVSTESYDFSNEKQDLDLFNPSTFEQRLRKDSIDTVICTAWTTTPGEFWTSPLNSQYRSATLRFAEACFKYGVSHFIGFGTMSEYGEKVGACDASVTIANPKSIYGKEKLLTGQQLTELSNAYKKRSTWLRIFQAYGRNEKVQRFLPSLLLSIKQAKSIEVYTPHDTLDWINVEDIADIVVNRVIYRSTPPIFDVGSGEILSVRQVTELAYSVVGLAHNSVTFKSQNEKDAKRLYINPDGFLASSGWQPSVKLAHFIRDSLQKVN